MKNSNERSRGLAGIALLVTLLGLAGCASTPEMGANKGVVTGSAGGSATENKNGQLEHCDQSLGTMVLEEDTSAPWFQQLGQHQLGSTIPVLRLMIQQSNCFVIVDRTRAMASMMRERELEAGGETRQGSKFGKGQMVAADYTMSPSIQFSGTTGGAGGGGVGLLGLVGAVAAAVKTNEASTTLLLIDNRSGVQIAAAEGTAKNHDFAMFGGMFAGVGAVGAGGYAKTPEGKVILAAFADSFNQMVISLRNYQAQTVKGGLGTGGRLQVDGSSTAVEPASAPPPKKKRIKKQAQPPPQ